MIVVGSGFIGLEMAAAPSQMGHRVRWVMGEGEPFERIFPPSLRGSLAHAYRVHGVEIVSHTGVARAGTSKGTPRITTRAGQEPCADAVVVGARWVVHGELLDGLIVGESMGVAADQFG